MAGSRYPNIDKLPGKKHYTGYGGGKVWQIKPDINAGKRVFSAWNIESKTAIIGDTLREISEQLAAMDAPKSNPINHMGEKEYYTFAGWKRAVKAIDPKAVFYGDRDIGGAFGIGEWDGEKGSIFTDETRVKILKYDPAMKAPGVNPIKRSKAARAKVKRATARRPAPVDHLIVAKLKKETKADIKKSGVRGLNTTIYFDGYKWTNDKEKAARWHDIEQAKKEARRVANSAALSDSSRNIYVMTD